MKQSSERNLQKQLIQMTDMQRHIFNIVLREKKEEAISKYGNICYLTQSKHLDGKNYITGKL